MKTKSLLSMFTAVSLLTVFSCAKEIAPIDTPQQTNPEVTTPTGAGTYTMSITAGKGEAGTKALSLSGSTLNATWADGETVGVYNSGDEKIGTLNVNDIRDNGATCTLTGALDTAPSQGETLTLKFCSPEYTTQDGTLTGNPTSIDKVCDYATATVTVKSVDSGNNVSIQESGANFVNQQAIVKFNLKNAAKTADILAKPLKLTIDGMEINVDPASAASELHVAVPAISGKSIVLVATTSNGTKGYTRSGVTLEQGKYYSITVGMSDANIVTNETQLNAAINNGAYIILNNDIPLQNSAKIGESGTQNVTIDLAGHSLSRSLGSVNDNGQVVKVFANSNLTITDSGSTGTGTKVDPVAGGTITGGWAGKGGGIYNAGTLNFQGGTITGNKANDCGGIYNASGATLNITGGTISGNTSNAGGGGVVNYGTATISGCTFSGNTATTRGGAIWSNSSLTVSNCTFTGNNALAKGGDEQNEGDGGAIHLDGGTATLTDVIITGNNSKDAGGIYVKSGATLNLGGTSTLSGNVSSEHGGGGIVNEGTVNLSGSVSITGNNCHTNGGGIWSNGTLTMQGTINVTGNTDRYDAETNVYLKAGHVVTVTGSLDESSIGISVQDNTGTVTSGLSGNGSLSSFSNDCPGAANLILDGGEAKFTAPSSIPYIEHVWNDNTNQLVSSTWDCSNYVELTGTDATRELTLADNTYYVVRGSDVRYKRLIAPYTQAYLILCDGAKLTSQITINNDDQGIQSLEIYGQSASSGQLVATGDYTSDGGTHWVQAGIGSSGKWKMGWLTIHGGTITASGVISTSSSPYGSAGIGGGGWGSETTHQSIDGGRVVIYGGTVTAYGGTYGAGIGGGCNYMQAGLTGADCYGGDGGLLIVYGGTVTAYGKNGSAGIGGGCNGYGGNVEIYGGTVKAYGNDGKGAGIGSGERLNGREDHTGGSVIINGGHVEAYGGKYAAGIGGGQGCSGASVRVNGGYVYADGGEDAAGIGSGEEQTILAPNTNGGSLTVCGGHVYADGTGWGAGIGAGEDSDGAEVHIYGGIVEASAGGYAATDSGCAFGSEDGDGHRGSLVIEPGLRVYGGDTSSSAVLCPTTGERAPYCYFRPYARIEPCTEHEYEDGKCKYCNHPQS